MQGTTEDKTIMGRVAPLSAICPGLVFGYPELLAREPVEKEQVHLGRSTGNAYGKGRRTSLPSYHSTIRRDPK